MSVSLSVERLLMELQAFLLKPESRFSCWFRADGRQVVSAPFNKEKTSSHQQDQGEEQRQDRGGVTPPSPAILAEVSSETVPTHTAHAGSLGDTGAVTVAALGGAGQRVWKNRVLVAGVR